MNMKAILIPRCHCVPSSLRWMTGILVTAHFDFLSFYTISEFRVYYFKIVFSLDSKSSLFSPQSGLQWRGIGRWGRGFCSHAPPSLLLALRTLLLVSVKVHFRFCGGS